MRELRDGLAIYAAALASVLASLWLINYLISLESRGANVVAFVVFLLGVCLAGLIGLVGLLFIVGGLAKLCAQAVMHGRSAVLRLCGR